MLGLSTLKSRISTSKYLTCVVVETCSTRNADDMQIESLLVVLLSKKAPLIIERNTASGHLNRAIFSDRYVMYTLYYPCTKFKGELPICDEDIAPETWRLFTPEFCAVKFVFVCSPVPPLENDCSLRSQ